MALCEWVRGGSEEVTEGTSSCKACRHCKSWEAGSRGGTWCELHCNGCAADAVWTDYGVRAGPGTAVRRLSQWYRGEMMVIWTKVDAEEVTRRDQILDRFEG